MSGVNRKHTPIHPDKGCLTAAPAPDAPGGACGIVASEALHALLERGLKAIVALAGARGGVIRLVPATGGAMRLVCAASAVAKIQESRSGPR